MSGPRASLASHGGSPLLLLFRLMIPAPTMHRRLLLLCLLFFALTACDSRAQTVQLTASNIRVDGVLLASGKLCVHPVNETNHLVAVKLGGPSGILATEPPCAAVNDGILTSGFLVPDTALTEPANVCLRITISDNHQDGKLVYAAQCVKPASSGPAAAGPQSWCKVSESVTICNFDNYVASAPTVTQAEAHNSANAPRLAREVRAASDERARTQGASMNAALFVGADFSVKVRACLAAVEAAGGGICDARELSGNQSVSETITVGDGINRTVLLAPVAWISMSPETQVILRSHATIQGQGASGTQFLCRSSTSCFQSFNEKDSTIDLSLSDFTIWEYMPPVRGSVGLRLGGPGYSDVGQSKFANLRITGGPSFDIGIQIGGDGGCTCYNVFDNVSSHAQSIGVSTVNFSHWAGDVNSNTWTSGQAWGAVGLSDVGGGKNRWIGLDIEGASKHAMIIGGYGNSVISPYLEASGPILLNGSFTSLMDGSWGEGSGSTISIDGASTCTSCFWFGADAPPLTLGVRNGIVFGAQFQNDLGGGTSAYTLLAPMGTEHLDLNFSGASINIYGHTGHALLHTGQLWAYGGVVGNGRSSIQALHDPPAPVVNSRGRTGKTTYKYAVVCHDWGGGVSKISAVATTTGSATLSKADYNEIDWNCGDGYSKADILKWDGSAWQQLAAEGAATNAIGSKAYPMKDMGQPLSTYSLPTRNSTGDFSIASQLSIGSNIVIPETVRGYQGSSGTKLQLAKGDAIAGHCAEFAADGSLEDSGVACATGRGPSSHAVAAPEEHSASATPKTSIGVLAAHSTNTGGAITGLSAETSVTLTFANDGWKNAAFCVASASVALQSAPYVSSISAKKVTFRFPQLTGTLYYHCDGN